MVQFQHLKLVSQSWFAHFKDAFVIGCKAGVGGVGLLVAWVVVWVHALYPDSFKSTATTLIRGIVKMLTQVLEENEAKKLRAKEEEKEEEVTKEE